MIRATAGAIAGAPRIPSWEEVAEKVVRTVAAHLGVRHTELAIGSHLRDDLHADLLDRIELAVTVEEQFGVRLPIEASMAAATVKDLITSLHEALTSKHPQAAAECGTNLEKERV